MAQGSFGTDDDWDGDDWDGDDLELIESEERLPWLAGEDEEEREAGFATSRLVMMGVLSLVMVAVLVAAAWFVLGATSDEPPADGSLVAAPEGPYKVKPEDAGGKIHPGTGQTSFAVGEGQTREGQLADRQPAAGPRPQATSESAAPSLATTLDEGPRAPAPARGTMVQVGAYPTRAGAEEAWGRLIRQTTVLNGVSHRVTQAQVDIGTVYRLQAVAGSNAAARSLCGRLKDDGLACFVK